MDEKQPQNLNTIADNLGGAIEKTQEGYQSHLKTVHTYADDMARAVHDKQGSVMKIAMAEEEKRREEYQNFSPASKRNVAYIVGTIVVLAIAVGVAAFVYFRATKETPIIDDANQGMQRFGILKPDETEEIIVGDLAKDHLYNIISTVFATEKDVKGALTLYPIVMEATNEQVASTEFLEAIDSEAPPQMMRTLSPIFDIGVYDDGEPQRFFLFATVSFDTAFASMLDWEATMYQEWAPFFGLPTTDASGKSLGNPTFGDRLIANRDARVVVNAQGEIIFLYSIVDDAHIVITDSTDTMKLVVERLNF